MSAALEAGDGSCPEGDLISTLIESMSEVLKKFCMSSSRLKIGSLEDAVLCSEVEGFDKFKGVESDISVGGANMSSV